MATTVEIDTLNGVISSTSSALAEALAEALGELIAAEYRASEEDLMEAVSFDLDEVRLPSGHRRSAA